MTVEDFAILFIVPDENGWKTEHTDAIYTVFADAQKAEIDWLMEVDK